MSNDIAIIGAGGFGREVKSLIDQINSVSAEYNFIGYYDDNQAKGTEVNDSVVLGNVNDINSVKNPLGIVIAIGNPLVKKNILDKIDNHNIFYPSLVHPQVYIDEKYVKIGQGCIVCGGAIITVNVEIGDHVILNLSSTVGHDTIIEDYCSFMPSVNISGEVRVKEGVYVGTGAKIINLVEIGENTIVGAGTIVTRTLPSDCTAVGIPAKVIKYNNEKNSIDL